eukprot:TRINITY_DN20795_c0_g1_i1.p1 TRINITY_DN20795_c0_g1~~TRINITY_DN20795_c0_g1_i1.p1  ORF type:complete len:1037 (+),score=316.76 TRINITY_DN20795_c0_g1_i1:238-3111(+)
MENIPAPFLTKDKGVEAYIKELQGKVETLKKTNRRLEDNNTKLKEKVRTSGRGVLPRYLGKSGGAAKKDNSASKNTTPKVVSMDVGVMADISVSPLERVAQESIAIGTSPRVATIMVDTQTSPKVASPLHPSLIPTKEPVPAALKRVRVTAPPSAVPVTITNLKQPPSDTLGPQFPPESLYTGRPEPNARLHTSLEEVLCQSETALEEKSSIIHQLESLVIALKDKLVQSEAIINELRDDVIARSVERDEAVKGRDMAYNERDLIINERDYTVKAKTRAEEDMKSQSNEIEILHRDRVRLREEMEQVMDRQRKERSRWDDNESSRMEALEALQLSLKEKNAALVILDSKSRELDERSSRLHSTNLDMLQEMENLTTHLSKSRVTVRDQELEIERLKLQCEATTASSEQYRRLREEYVGLQREHSLAMDRVLETRNITEMDVRQETKGEIEILKNTIVKWEAASKTQFKQYQTLCLKLDDAVKERDEVTMKLAEVEAGRRQVKGENEILDTKLALLVKDSGGQEVLDRLKMDEIVMAMEIVKRAEGMKSIKDMVKELTQEERQDAVIELQAVNEELRRELAVMAKNQQQLRRRVDDAEGDANRQVSLAAIKVKQFEEQHKTNTLQAQNILDIQADQIANLTKAVRYGSDAPSMDTSFSLDTDVGADNILQISIGALQPFPGVNLTAGGVVGCLDFFSFETVATREHFEENPNFDSHFIFRLEETPDVQTYLSAINSTVELRSKGNVVAVGLLSCAQLLGTANRTTAQGKISLCAEGSLGRTCGFLNVRLKLKRPLPWTVPELVDQPLDGLQVRQVLPITAQLEGREKLVRVTGLNVVIDDVDLAEAAKSSIFMTVCGLDVWFAQLEGEPTKHPTYGGRKLVAVTGSDPALVDNLRESLPLVLFDDTQREVTDCVGSAKVPTESLLASDKAVINTRVTFLTTDQRTAGSARVQISWEVP